MTQNRHSRPETRLRLGSMLAEQSRRIGLTNEDAEALEQTRDRTPAEPLSFEDRVLTRLDEHFAQRPEQSTVAMPAALSDRSAMLTQGMEVDPRRRDRRGFAALAMLSEQGCSEFRARYRKRRDSGIVVARTILCRRRSMWPRRTPPAIAP